MLAVHLIFEANKTEAALQLAAENASSAINLNVLPLSIKYMCPIVLA